MTLKTIFDLTISTITPLHIGNGDRLEREMDYAVHAGHTWVINQQKVWETYLFDEAGNYLEQLQETPPARLLQSDDFHQNSNLFHYVLNGEPLSTDQNAPIYGFMKDMDFRPYIPGSSLKGAVRTLLLRHAYIERNHRLRVGSVDNRARMAARSIERTLLSPGAEKPFLSPNYDLLRAIQIADTRPVAIDKMQIFTATVFKRNFSKHMPVALECVVGDVVFKTTLTIDEYLYRNKSAANKLNLPPREWLSSLPEIANAQAKERIQQEQGFFSQWNGSTAHTLYLKSLPDDPAAALGKNRFLLQLGWGGGWEDKTLGYLLSPSTRSELLKKYGRWAMARGRHTDGDAYPMTRRQLTSNLENKPQPIPLGWVLVEIMEKKQD